MLGHRDDATLSELNEALFEATLNGNEQKIRSLQETMRERFGGLF